MLTHEAAGKVVSTHPTRADEGNLAEWEIHIENLWDVVTTCILRSWQGEWVSKSSGRDVAQFSANEIFFCVMGLVFSVRYFVFRYLTKFFCWRIVCIFAVPYGTIYCSLAICSCDCVSVRFSSSLTIRLPISVGVLHLHC